MANNVVNQKQAEVINNTFIDNLGEQLKRKQELGLKFPTGYNVSNELTGAYLILKETLDANKKSVLESCTPNSVATALMEMCTSGLSMLKKQCYPIAYGGKLQCHISVYGNTCIARRYGMKSIDATCIYEGDEFSYHIENARKVIDVHKQNFENIDNAKIKGVYAVIIMEDGSVYTEIMNMPMIVQAWKQGFGYKENGNGTHQKFTDQMCMKTVKNRALKYIIRTYGTVELEMFENTEASETKDIVLEDVNYEIEQNANAQPFQIEQQEEPTTVAEVVETVQEKEPVKVKDVPKAEPVQQESAPFMQ